MRDDQGRGWRRIQNGVLPEAVARRCQRGAVGWWLLLVLGVVGGVVLYWYLMPQEAPSWVRSGLPSMSEHTGALYRWRDAQGREQISDKPPKDRPYETVHYRADTNVVRPWNSPSRP
ncbi:MAG: DUF4124 domain-containing protein [Phycisphaerales bacterium]|nr:DUF4124 domain-containing protein [Phycisphaerales bacterium]